MGSCFTANERAIGKAGQRKLSGATVGIAGLGGVGGIAFELLVRAGLGTVKIADSGFFEASNANRQSLWSIKNDGMKKTEAARLFASEINEQCKLVISPHLTAKNSLSFCRGCNAIIDATDSARSRAIIWKACKSKNTPYIFSSALSHRGLLTVIGKNSRNPFAGKKFLSMDENCDHSLGPVANAIGCLAAQQAINIILKQPHIAYPQVLSFDAFSREQFTLHRF